MKKKHKKYFCNYCGQEVTEETNTKYMMKKCKDWGMPSLAKLLQISLNTKKKK